MITDTTYHTALLDDDDRKLVQQQWRAADVALPELTVPTLFARQVASTPNAVAVETDAGSVSYAELDARSARFAQRLADAGVAPGDMVTVLVERSLSLVVALLGVARAGATYVPLDPGDPVARMRHTAAVSTLLVVDDVSWTHHPVAAGRRTLMVTSEVPDAAEFNDATTDPAALLYVMYTSGSTGTPKGVAVTHANVAALALDRIWRGGAHERVLLHSPHAFDASTYELWVPLLSGGRVVIAPGRIDATVVRRLAGTRRITALWLTAGLFGALAEADPGCLDGVQEVWVGGDVVAPNAVDRVRSACPRIWVVNGYGPTETTTFAARYRVPNRPVGGRGLPIGTAMDNTRLYVLDEALRLLPPGVTGELHVGGAGVARGYVDQPSTTAIRFLPDPFGVRGERMYATGDLVCREPDGCLRFVGRADGQVKINGFRVETGEIETALGTHPAVSRVVVTVRKSSDGSGAIHAHVVASDPAAIDPERLLAYAGERLPSYMVPARIVLVDDLPLTANDKVDRTALSEQDIAPVRPGTGVARGRSEQRVAAVWQTVLGVDTVGPDDNFFDIGGNSLKLVGLHARLCAEFGRELPIQWLFENSTVRTMARTITDIAATPTSAADSELATRGAARRGRLQRGRGR